MRGEGGGGRHAAQARRHLHVIFVDSASKLCAAPPGEHHGVEDAHVGCFAEPDDGRKRGRLLVNTEHATSVVSEGGRHRAGDDRAGGKPSSFQAAAAKMTRLNRLLHRAPMSVVLLAALILVSLGGSACDHFPNTVSGRRSGAFRSKLWLVTTSLVSYIESRYQHPVQ